MKRAIASTGGRRPWALWLAALAAVLAAAFPGAASARHNRDSHTDNMSIVGNFNDDGKYFQGSDLGFWGNTAVAGNYGGFRLLDISRPAAPAELVDFSCPGPQNDVTIWKDLVFLSVDSPRVGPECGEGTASSAQQTAGTDWEGIRVVSVADRGSPQQIAAVRTDCGSHTHTLVPDERNARVLLYVLSYPPTGGAPTPTCNPERHRKISVVEVPLGAPQDAKVVSQPRMPVALGCHDVTVFLERRIAAAACNRDDTQLWDISDPVNPRVVGSIRNPAINFHHSTAFSWSGKTLVVGDEFAGAAAPHSCATGNAPVGALWFYDVTNPAAPVQRAYYQVPSGDIVELCTAHNFNVVPLARGKDILVASWYAAGTTVLDFTNPSRVARIGHYVAVEPSAADTWSSYWYNGHIYGSNFGASTVPSRGVDVMAIDHPDLRDWIPLTRANPQTQEPLFGPGGTGAGGGGPGAGRRVAGSRAEGRLLISRRSRRLARGGVVPVAVSCRSARPCRGILRLRTALRSSRGRTVRNVTLGGGRFVVGARRRAVLGVRLSASGRRLVARLGRTRVLVIANVQTLRSESRTGTVTGTFRLVAGSTRSARRPT